MKKFHIPKCRLIPEKYMNNPICKEHENCRTCKHCKLDFSSGREVKPVCTIENLLKMK